LQWLLLLLLLLLLLESNRVHENRCRRLLLSRPSRVIRVIHLYWL
jgi:hypothetical protein